MVFTGWTGRRRNPDADIVFPLALRKIPAWTGLSLMTARLRCFSRNVPICSPGTAPSLEIRNLSWPSKEEAVGK